MHYKVKNMEFFKDGTILGDRQLKPGEICIFDEVTVRKIQNSGGTLEIIEKVIPNPLKQVKPEEQAIEKPIEVTVEEPQPVKRKAGRPRKNG